MPLWDFRADRVTAAACATYVWRRPSVRSSTSAVCVLVDAHSEPADPGRRTRSYQVRHAACMSPNFAHS